MVFYFIIHKKTLNISCCVKHCSDLSNAENLQQIAECSKFV